MKKAPRPAPKARSERVAQHTGVLQVSRRRHALTGFLFALPFLAGFFAFYLVPFAISIGQSFFKPGRFAGGENYAEVFASDAFRLAAFNTGRFMLIGVPLVMVLSMVLALLLYRRFAGAGLIRSVFLFPLVVPIASTVMVVQVFFAEGGIANSLLAALGLSVQSWLQSEWAFALLLFLYVWKNIGYNIVLLLRG